LDVMTRPDALPVCSLIAALPFDWAPPQTSSTPLYVEHSRAKVHVELLGPDGLIRSDRVRLGLYGMTPHAEYGIRTHPAEEI
ncbi:MAG: dimethylsulfonioproprionate lyase family protein, partial [Paracoccaceae bacterium]|nr:dimethylsulfonioproprionate lyase family protein [Paracoccaceae bacterium]